jgi:hypothetical protein
LASALLCAACQPADGPEQAAEVQAEATAAATQGRVQRPDFRLDATEGFDANTIPPYPGDHEAVYRHIDANLDAHVANIQRWVRQPSISAQDDGIREMAEMLRQDLAALGFQEAELVPTDGHPGVWGYYDAGAERTLMLYMMYDVQPVEPDDWQSPPFAAGLVDHELGTVLMGRGVEVVVRMEVEGEVSGPGEYGHLGVYDRELIATRIISVEAASEEAFQAAAEAAAPE